MPNLCRNEPLLWGNSLVESFNCVQLIALSCRFARNGEHLWGWGSQFSQVPISNLVDAAKSCLWASPTRKKQLFLAGGLVTRGQTLKKTCQRTRWEMRDPFSTHDVDCGGGVSLPARNWIIQIKRLWQRALNQTLWYLFHPELTRYPLVQQHSPPLPLEHCPAV